MKTTKKDRKAPYMLICGLLILLIVYFFAVKLYDSKQKEEVSLFVGTYTLGDQTDDDCIYLCVGDKNPEGNYVCVLYKQGDLDFVFADTALIKDKEVSSFSGENAINLQKVGNKYDITYGGLSYPIEKISETPSFASNEEAYKRFAEYYE